MKASPNNKTGALIKSRREELRLSQRDLAKAIQLDSHQPISHIETNQMKLPRRHLFAVAIALKMDPLILVEALVEDTRDTILEEIGALRTPPSQAKPPAPSTTPAKRAAVPSNPAMIELQNKMRIFRAKRSA
jgi:transcriptional regulator with XRE-family HTH domain